MKHTKLLSLILAIALVFALGTSVFAAETTGSITVDNPLADQTYIAYKIFDVTYNADKSAYSYTIESTSPWYSTVSDYAKDKNNGLTLTKATGGDVYVVTIGDNFSAAKFAAALQKANVTGDTGTTLTLDNDKATASNLSLGYYFVTSTSGALCNLTTTNPSVTIHDKNDIAFDKTDDQQSVDVGQVVNYVVTGKVPDTTGFKFYTYKITDKMSEGLTFNKDSFKILVGNNELDAIYYTVDFDKSTNGGFDYVLTIDVKKLQEQVGKEIEVKYTATVNEKAAAKVEKNHAVLTYSNNPADEQSTATREDEETVYSAKIVIDKYKANSKETKLADAQFVLVKKDAENKETFYKYDEESKKVSWVSDINDATVKTTDENGACSFDGVADETYFLREIAAPDGYNMLTKDVNVVVNGANVSNTDSSSLTVKAEVANQSGTELPSTGGMGTKMFYVFGSILVLGALVLLVVRRRMRTEK